MHGTASPVPSFRLQHNGGEQQPKERHAADQELEGMIDNLAPCTFEHAPTAHHADQDRGQSHERSPQTSRPYLGRGERRLAHHDHGVPAKI